MEKDQLSLFLKEQEEGKIHKEKIDKLCDGIECLKKDNIEMKKEIGELKRKEEEKRKLNEIKTEKCPGCGFDVLINSKFCGNCKAELDWD